MRTILALCAAIILLTACGEAPTPLPTTEGEGDTLIPTEISIGATPDPQHSPLPVMGRGLGGGAAGTVDESALFRLTHHYSENFNFTVHADSLVLLPAEGETAMDTAIVRKGDLLVVAQVKCLASADTLAPDSFAIKVARDQWTMGWIGEEELLAGVVPDDTLSEIIHLTHPWLLSLLAVLAALLVWIAARLRLPRLYPTLLLSCTLLLSALGAYVRHIVPEFWREFYFHPTLNPLILPLPLACYVATAWLTLICAVAIGIDWYGHHREPQEQ